MLRMFLRPHRAAFREGRPTQAEYFYLQDPGKGDIPGYGFFRKRVIRTQAVHSSPVKADTDPGIGSFCLSQRNRHGYAVNPDVTNAGYGSGQPTVVRLPMGSRRPELRTHSSRSRGGRNQIGDRNTACIHDSLPFANFNLLFCAALCYHYRAYYCGNLTG